MTIWLKQIFWMATGLLVGLNQSPKAAPCLRITGVIQDYANHKPITAQLYLKTQKGRVNLGTSLAQTGQFSVDITCPASALIIEKTGYRSQTLQLNFSTTTDKPVGVIIPLVAIDQPKLDQPYFQTEQTHFVQSDEKQNGIRPQRSKFVVSDALTGELLPAQTCFFFTKTNQKRCIDVGSKGEFTINFTEKDIVAIEVSAPGYQTYQGNLVVEQLDGRQIKHEVRLTRELTILSVQLEPLASSCELLSKNPAGKTVILEPVPGLTNTVATYNLQPQQYTLVILDRQRIKREQRVVSIRSGLNVASSLTSTPVASRPPVPSEALTPIRPDSLPLLYFEQGSYTLQPASKTALYQIAAYLNQHPELAIRILGHTDKEGDEQLNRLLAEFRAKVAASFLSQQGISDDRMKIIGYGSRFPVSPSDTEENKAKNRRVNVKFVARENP